ncbi:MAG: hypothetical protein FJ276_00135 [Planctomycetes bacterium]|nr:hypothetical protein [Planctomycetota bacterium]
MMCWRRPAGRDFVRTKDGARTAGDAGISLQETGNDPAGSRGLAAILPVDRAGGGEFFDGKIRELWRGDVMRQPWKRFPLRRELAGPVAGSVDISKQEAVELAATLVIALCWCGHSPVAIAR